MSTFDLDTSGSVDHVMLHGCVETGLEIDWSDLTPFAQGFLGAAKQHMPVVCREGGESLDWGFRHLAPATVERIIADCARMQPVEPRAYNADALRHMGAKSWRQRQRGHFASFSALTVYLSDDGLIMLREVGE